jgi:hypothetical protein
VTFLKDQFLKIRGEEEEEKKAVHRFKYDVI